MVYFCIKISKKNKEEKKIEKCHFWKKLTQINSLAQNPTQESPKFRPKDQSSLLAVGPTHNSQKPPSCDTWRGLVLPRVNSSSAASVRSQATCRPPIQAVNECTDPEATPPRRHVPSEPLAHEVPRSCHASAAWRSARPHSSTAPAARAWRAQPMSPTRGDVMAELLPAWHMSCTEKGRESHDATCPTSAQISMPLSHLFLHDFTKFTV